MIKIALRLMVRIPKTKKKTSTAILVSPEWTRRLIINTNICNDTTKLETNQLLPIWRHIEASKLSIQCRRAKFGFKHGFLLTKSFPVLCTIVVVVREVIFKTPVMRSDHNGASDDGDDSQYLWFQETPFIANKRKRWLIISLCVYLKSTKNLPCISKVLDGDLSSTYQLLQLD